MEHINEASPTVPSDETNNKNDLGDSYLHTGLLLIWKSVSCTLVCLTLQAIILWPLKHIGSQPLIFYTSAAWRMIALTYIFASFFFFFSMWDHFMKTVLLKFCMFMSCLQSSMKVHWIILWQNSFKNAVWWKRKKSIILNSLMPDSSPPSFASRPNQLVCQLTNPQPSPLTSPTVAHFLESLTKSWMLSI